MSEGAESGRLLALIRRQALLQGGDFELASGARASVYVDLRRVTLLPAGATAIAALLLARLDGAAIAAVGGMATAAIPLVAALVVASAAGAHPLRGFYVRDRPKERGTGRLIEGQLRPGDRVALVEDTVTSGRSTMAAAEAVLAAGAHVERIVAVVDRQQGAAALYAGRGIPFESLFTLEEIAGPAASRHHGPSR